MRPPPTRIRAGFHSAPRTRHTLKYMIRNVVMGKLREGDDPEADLEQLNRGLGGIAALTLPGLLANRVGLDEGLRDGGWSFAITNDWIDVDAYLGYDTDPEHNGYRAMIAEVCEQVARVQFEID